MGQAQPFEKEKLIVALIYHDPAVLDVARERLTEAFGPIEAQSEEYSFSELYSDYYDEELGGEGLRRIYSFAEPVAPQRQAQIKTLTNRMEADLSVNGKRKINLDPGLMNIGRLLLATTKPAWFRIPLADGIYTELTLFYSRGEWQELLWTYRDYRSPAVKAFLTDVHKTYLKQRKAGLTRI